MVIIICHTWFTNIVLCYFTISTMTDHTPSCIAKITVVVVWKKKNLVSTLLLLCLAIAAR